MHLRVADPPAQEESEWGGVQQRSAARTMVATTNWYGVRNLTPPPQRSRLELGSSNKRSINLLEIAAVVSQRSASAHQALGWLICHEVPCKLQRQMMSSGWALCQKLKRRTPLRLASIGKSRRSNV